MDHRRRGEGMGSGNLDLAEIIITVFKPFQDDDVLACASLAEKKGRDPANFEIRVVSFALSRPDHAFAP
jgi:hypothetical protein